MSGQKFDFCAAIGRLCEDVCRRHPEFRHIDMSRVVVTFAQTRSPVEWGMQAKLTPMRFRDGALTERRGRRTWTIQRLMHNGREMLYILTFYLPRFLNQTYNEKLVTVFHELYHISPKFDGDIRRFSGSCYMHTGSQAGYDRQMAVFVRQYLRMGSPVELRAFLKHDFTKLRKTHGTVVGLRVAVPRLLPVDDAA
ncbi:MAG: putative metallopeptidase [Fuerstiella sp.]